MDEADTAMMTGVQFIFDPVKKTAMIIRSESAIPVPGRFDSYQDAHSACLRMLREKYATPTGNQ